MMMDIVAEDDENMWLEADLRERGAYLGDGLLSSDYEPVLEVEPTDLVWPESELDAGGEVSDGNHLLYEMVDFFESANRQTMFVCVGGRNYLIRREDGVYGISA